MQFLCVCDYFFFNSSNLIVMQPVKMNYTLQNSFMSVELAVVKTT